MAMITALSSRGQIVLPKKLRNALNLVEGTQSVSYTHLTLPTTERV